MADNQKGGAEVQSELAQQASMLTQKDSTTSERLDKFFSQPGAKYGEQGQEAPTTPAQSVESQQPVTTPVTKQTQDESRTSQDAPQTPVQQQTVQPTQEVQQPNEYALPEGASERTREQFERLLAENKRLKEGREQSVAKPKGNSVFDEFRQGQQVVPTQPQAVPGQYQPEVPQYPVQQQQVPQYPQQVQYPQQPAPQMQSLSPQQVQQITQQFIAPDGTVDINGLNQALWNADRRAAFAEQQSLQAQRASLQTQQRIEKFEEDQQVREAHTAVPEIDPHSDKFNPELYKLVTERIFNNMQLGRNERLLDVASTLKKVIASDKVAQNVGKVQDEAVTKYKEAQAARDQMPLESGVGQPRQTLNFQQAREKTRKGGIDNPFLDERLRNAGIIS